MKYILSLLSCLALLGCSASGDDLDEFMENAAQDVRGKLPPPLVVSKYEFMVYDNSKKEMTPFFPRKPKNKVGANGPDLNHEKTPLEEFSLDTLRMIGFLEKRGILYALIESPDGKLHHARLGSYIGVNYGRIFELTKERAKVVEYLQDDEGRWRTSINSLSLQQKVEQ